MIYLLIPSSGTTATAGTATCVTTGISGERNGRSAGNGSGIIAHTIENGRSGGADTGSQCRCRSTGDNKGCDPLLGVLKANTSLPTVRAYQVLLLHDEAE